MKCACLLGLLCIGGCGKPLPPPPPASPPPVMKLTYGLPTAEESFTLEPHQHVIMQLDVYQLLVPFGAVSRNDDFWKRVDENRLEVATYDLLLKNGIRVGIAHNAEWDYFKSLIDDYHASAQKGTASGANGGSVELSLKNGIETQNLFYLNDRNILCGRTYDRCENLLAVSFEPAQRHPGDCVVTVCPLVRGLRKIYEVTVLNQEQEIELVKPECLYDLGLKTTVPFDHFLVMAPSKQSTWPASMGNSFLVKPGHAEQQETILLLVPRPFRVRDVVSER